MVMGNFPKFQIVIYRKSNSHRRSQVFLPILEDCLSQFPRRPLPNLCSPCSVVYEVNHLWWGMNRDPSR